MNRSLNRRLAVIEGSRFSMEPTRMLADRPMTEEEGAEALCNWRALVASGDASVSHDTLCLIGPPMTSEEWEAENCRAGYTA